MWQQVAHGYLLQQVIPAACHSQYLAAASTADDIRPLTAAAAAAAAGTAAAVASGNSMFAAAVGPCSVPGTQHVSVSHRGIGTVLAAESPTQPV